MVLWVILFTCIFFFSIFQVSVSISELLSKFKKKDISKIHQKGIVSGMNIIMIKNAHVLSQFSRVWLCNPMDHSPPGSSVHEILQGRILEWVAMFSSRGSSPPRDRTCVSYWYPGVFTTRDTWEAPVIKNNSTKKKKKRIVGLLRGMIIYCIANLCLFTLVSFLLLSHDFGLLFLRSKQKLLCSPPILPLLHKKF